MNAVENQDSAKSTGPVRIEQAFARYSKWFSDYGNYLWTLALFPDWNKEEVSLDFQEVTFALRKRFLQDPEWDEYDALFYFWNEWNRRIVHKSKRKQASHLSVPLMLFGFKWPLSRVSRVTGWSLSHLRFVSFETLRNIQKNPLSPLSLSRDCMRSDLFVIEHMLGESWNDAFQVFGPKNLSQHLDKCSRCSKQLVSLKEAAQLFRNVSLENVPEHIEGVVSKMELPTTRTQFIKFQYHLLGFFPKLVLQTSVVTLVLVALLNMPFIGNFSMAGFKPLQTISQVWGLGQELLLASVDKVRALIPETKKVPETPVASTDTTEEMDSTSSSVALAPLPANPIVSVPAPTPTPAAPTPVAKTPVVEVPPKVAAAEKVLEKAVEKTAKPAKAEKIFLRWGSFTDDLDGFTPRILEILTQYQAEKAGDLELGAEYRGGRYFHFRIPEEHREIVQKEIQALNMKNFYVDTAPSSRAEIPGKVRVVFLVRPQRQ